MKKHLGIFATLLALLGCGEKETDLKTVDYVDAEKYMGTWYDVASFPQRFQKNCKCTSAEYKLLDDETIEVYNRCINKETGKVQDITGKAFIADKTTNAKLKVQFFWPFKGAYWIIELADDYSHAVVSEPGKNYLWILSRTPNMPKEQLDAIIDRLKEKGFDTSRIVFTTHDCEE
jgi:apolipoprotein D and lipocalin family protein